MRTIHLRLEKRFPSHKLQRILTCNWKRNVREAWRERLFGGEQIADKATLALDAPAKRYALPCTQSLEVPCQRAF
jgi:hypothetical protein